MQRILQENKGIKILLDGSELKRVCLALQMVLDDSAQIRTTLQGFGSVLKEMSQVCDVTTLQEQLDEADHQVAIVQDGFTAPLSHLGHAAAVSRPLYPFLLLFESSLNSLNPEMCR